MFYFIVVFKIGDVGLLGVSFFIWYGNEVGDDDNIVDIGVVGCCIVNRNNFWIVFCCDGISGEMFVVGDILDINGFVFENIGCVKKILVNGVRIFIV